MNTKIILVASLVAVFTIGLYADSAVAFAQYMGNVGSAGETGSYTLEAVSYTHLTLPTTPYV